MYLIYLELLTMLSEVAQSCPTLCDHTDCNLPGFSVHRMFQARVLEWVAVSFSRRSSRPRDWTRVSRIVGRHFYHLSHQGRSLTTLFKPKYIMFLKKSPKLIRRWYFFNPICPSPPHSHIIYSDNVICTFLERFFLMWYYSQYILIRLRSERKSTQQQIGMDIELMFILSKSNSYSKPQKYIKADLNMRDIYKGLLNIAGKESWREKCESIHMLLNWLS